MEGTLLGERLLDILFFGEDFLDRDEWIDGWMDEWIVRGV